jgi:uncharacterized membrane protein YbhN (UPF0104 family)
LTSPESSAPTGAGPRRVLAGILGAVLAIALLLWALRGVHLDEVARQIRQSDPWPLALGVVLASLTFVVRLIRWRLLLRDESGAPLKAWPLWHATAIGFMANNLLPFRAVAVERIFDGLTVVALLAVGLLFSDLPAGVVVGGVRLAHAAQVAGLLGLGALLGAVAIVAFPLAAERLVRRVLPEGRFAERIVGMIEGLRQGLASLRSPGLLAGVVFWSLVHWLMNAVALWVSFAAFDIPVGFGGALVLQGVLAIGVSVQLTPGFVGQFEASIVAALGLYGIPNDVASSYALAYHGATFLPITLAGAWSLARTPVALSDLRGASQA